MVLYQSTYVLIYVNHFLWFYNYANTFGPFK